MKIAGQIAMPVRPGDRVLVLARAADAYEFRPGDVFWTGWSKDPDQRRLGEHRVERIDPECGVLHTQVPLTETSPSVCTNDWIFVADRTPQWSPYR